MQSCHDCQISLLADEEESIYGHCPMGCMHSYARLKSQLDRQQLTRQAKAVNDLW